jgi:hypothetical protein
MLINRNHFLFTSFLFVVFFVALSMFIANSLGTAYGQSQILPFEIGDIVTQKNITNPNNQSNITVDPSYEVNPCNMPPCPPGQACIQSCPQ